MISVVIELVMGFLQYFAFITALDVNFPESWKSPMYYFSVVNLDFVLMKDWIPALNDIRLYFMFLSVVGPLFFILLGLFFLNKKRVVLWYLLVVFAIMLVVAGVFGRIIAASTDLAVDEQTAEALIYAGLGLLIVSAVLFALNKYAPCFREMITDKTEKHEVMTEETRTLSVATLMERILYIIILLIIAVIGFRVIAADFADSIDEFIADGFMFGLAIAFSVVLVLLFAWTIMGCSGTGRRHQWEITQFLESSFLKILLVSMSLAYIPIGSGVFLMFNCNDFTCPAGYRLPDRGSVVVFNSTTGAGEFCAPCNAALFTQRCPTSVQQAMCNQPTQERLEFEVATDCEGMSTFYWPAAFIIIIMYLIGVPAMFHHLIFVSTTAIFNSFPATLRDLEQYDLEGGILTQQVTNVDYDDEEENEMWMLKVAQSCNCARFLYSPFEYRYRYVRLFQLIQKLAIVGTSVYIVRNMGVSPTAISLGCSLAIHFVATAALLKHKPFIVPFEDRIAQAMSAALTLACVVAILLLNGVDIPAWLMVVLIIANGILPLFALIVGIVLEFRSSKKSEEEIAREERNRIAAEVQRREVEDEEERAAIEEQIDTDNYLAAVNMSAIEAGQLPPGSVDTTYTPVQNLQRSNSVVARERVEKENVAKREVAEEMEEEKKLLRERQETVDLQVDRVVKSKLNRFLMVAGVLGFLALGCCILGLMVKDDQSVLEPFPETHTTATELAGYSNWQEFTDNCCCSANYNRQQDSSYVTVEKWYCANKKIKERVRQRTENNGVVDGTAVRPLCGMDFNAPCFITTTGEDVVVSCPGNTIASNVQILW